MAISLSHDINGEFDVWCWYLFQQTFSGFWYWSSCWCLSPMASERAERIFISLPLVGFFGQVWVLSDVAFVWECVIIWELIGIECHLLHWKDCGMVMSWYCWSLWGLDATHYIGGFVEWGGVYGDWMPHIALDGLWNGEELIVLEFMGTGYHTLHWRVCGMGRSWLCWSLWGLDVTHCIGWLVEWGGVDSVGVYGDWMSHITLEGLWNVEGLIVLELCGLDVTHYIEGFWNGEEFMWIGCHTLHWRVFWNGGGVYVDWMSHITLEGLWNGEELIVLEFMWIGCHTLHWRVCGMGRSWLGHWRVCGMGRSLCGLDVTHYIGGFVEWGGADCAGVYVDWMSHITL